MNNIATRMTNSMSALRKSQQYVQELEAQQEDRRNRLEKFLRKQTIAQLKAALKELWPTGVVITDRENGFPLGTYTYRMYPNKVRNGCGETYGFTKKGIYIAALELVIGTELEKKRRRAA